jgi:hypothetical protein
MCIIVNVLDTIENDNVENGIQGTTYKNAPDQRIADAFCLS